MSFNQWSIRGLQTLLIAAIALYGVDWAMLHVRIKQGTAFSTIQVHQFLATPLKGNKQEYDYDGDLPERCSRSIFPQAGYPPCWWLSRHTTEWE
ncbi:MAG TPA: hypothetical protein VGC07_06525 [Granulicella sp.]